MEQKADPTSSRASPARVEHEYEKSLMLFENEHFVCQSTACMTKVISQDWGFNLKDVNGYLDQIKDNCDTKEG